MKLPNLDKAVIPRAKLTQYLLSGTHPYGRHKAAFFLRFGFRRESWKVLTSALTALAEDHEVAVVEDTPFGTRYNVEGILRTPDGRNPVVRVQYDLVEVGLDLAPSEAIQSIR